MSNASVYVQANSNGRLHDAREAAVSPLNRGFLYGDAIYEVWRTYHGVIFAWEEHWARLERSAEALFLTLPLLANTALSELKRTVAEHQRVTASGADKYIRLQITRGAGAIGLDVALADKPDYVVLVQPNAVFPSEKLRAGLRLSMATTLRRNPVEALNPAWKTGNYLNNILCLREARARGADEVVILNRAGEITEAAVSNIGFVRRGEIITPPLTTGLLGGITRGLLINEISRRAGYPVREHPVYPAELDTMDECFLLSTTKDITPVASIDSHAFTTGTDTVAWRLKTAFAQYAREYAGRRTDLRLD